MIKPAAYCLAGSVNMGNVILALTAIALGPAAVNAVADDVADRQAEYLNDYYNSFKNSSELGIDADVSINVAFTAFALNKPQAEIDAANAALNQYLTGKEDYWNGQTGDPATIDGYWASRTLPLLALDPSLKQHLTSDNEAKLKAYLHSFSLHRDEVDKPSVDAADRTRIFESGNHDMHARTVHFLTAQLLKDDPAYAGNTFVGGETAEQRFGRWTTNLLDYFQDRAGKGGTVEVDSPLYAATYHSPVFNIAEYAEDPRLKAISREYLNLHMADLAQKTTEGMPGGAKSRAGKNRVLSPDSHRSIQYLYPFTGHPDEGMGVGVVPGGAQLGRILGGATTTDYRVPQEIIDLIADEDGRGVYTYTTNRLGEGTRTTVNGKNVSTPSATQSSLVHTTRVTPEYTLGWFTLDENKDYLPISGQSQAMMAITDASRTSRLVMNLTGGKVNDELQGVGDGDAMMFRRQIGNHGGQTPRVYVSNDFTYGLEGDGWVFGTDGSGSYFAIKGVLPTNGSAVSYTPVDASSDGGNGYYLTYDNDDTVVLVQMGRASNYTDLEDFKADIRDNPLNFNNGAVTYDPGAAGQQLTMFNNRTVPQVGGQTVDLTPAKVYDSLYLSADYGSKYITVGSLDYYSFNLDFDYDPVAPAQQRYISSSTLSEEVFSPGYREMVGVTEFSSDTLLPITYTIGSTGVMQIDFDGFHNVMDTMVVNGALHMGGELRVNMIRDIPDQPGTFQLFDANSITGSFDTITLPATAGNLFWLTDDLYTTGEIRLMQGESMLLGDQDGFAFDGPGSADDVPVDPNWESQFTGFTLAMLDEPGKNKTRLASFDLSSFDPNGAIAARIEIKVGQYESGYENDSLFIDDLSNGVQLSTLESMDLGELGDVLYYEFTESDLDLLADGLLNIAIRDDTAIDWVRLAWVMPAGIPGDFDSDGDVDGADFLLWQTNPSVGDLADWHAHYGITASTTQPTSTVPEPNTLILLASIQFAFFYRYRYSRFSSSRS